MVNVSFCSVAKLSSLCCMLCLVASGSTLAKSDPEKQTIRFYKINKDQISQKIAFTNRKARKSGCHNFIKKVRLYKTVQFAYTSCRVYSKKECPEDAIVSFYTEKNSDLHQTDLSQGFGWRPVSEHPRGKIVKSWFCE